MHSVFQDENDVTGEHNPQSNRYIIFKKDGSFETGGDPYALNTGLFYVNSLRKTLYIDSGVGPDDDSSWYFSFDGEKLIWRGFGNEFAAGFKIVHVRKSE